MYFYCLKQLAVYFECFSRVQLRQNGLGCGGWHHAERGAEAALAEERERAAEARVLAQAQGGAEVYEVHHAETCPRDPFPSSIDGGRKTSSTAAPLTVDPATLAIAASIALS